ncbi:putative dehydrogenase [Pedobacter africanus]|uniref:Dehydrogenase n=1 Tax=Pedobacter africanus TaxID=151894 RepID=A0ACC6L3P5_9SPHI|nr:Gfo/Idh/MocA family oxidoreductase [Pedobacter africanus]MDR6786132.1 putative dehydrogenase [Pedobacter africanus]
MNSSSHIRLGVLGMSDGNGHPYSWSAIFNGYEREHMKNGPFPGIFEYLEKQKFPEDMIIEASVTHVWTQDIRLSEHIARSSNIPYIVKDYREMIGRVDAVLLARDDAENHYEMSREFLDAGLPIFIDKPLAYDVDTAKAIFALQKYPNQIFSCSSLRYANEFLLDQQAMDNIGQIRFIDATVPKSWNKYGVHVIEPILAIVGFDKEILYFNSVRTEEGVVVTLKFSNAITCSIKAIEAAASPITITVSGSRGYRTMNFMDSFNAFKTSLISFINVIRDLENGIPMAHTLKIVDIIEKGNILSNKQI